MGNKLLDYFNKADEIGGLPAKIRLAALSKSSSLQAKTMEDSLENIQTMKESFEIVSQEFDIKKHERLEQTVEYTALDTVKILRNYIEAFSEVLLSQLQNDTLELAAQQITTVLAETLRVGRASIWLYNEDTSRIECMNLYERDKRLHSNGMILLQKDFPNYFKAISNNLTLVAEDAHTHPGTAEFSESYLQPNGINSMLDVPIFFDGKIVGVICHEHTGPNRKWTRDEENFAFLMSNILSNTLKKDS